MKSLIKSRLDFFEPTPNTNTGIWQGLLLISITTCVTTITALSMSAISTNGIIKGGGTYFMISVSVNILNHQHFLILMLTHMYLKSAHSVQNSVEVLDSYFL